MSYFFTFGTKNYNNATTVDVFKGTTPFNIMGSLNVTSSPNGTYPLTNDVQGTSVYNDVNYNVYTFTNTTTTVTSYTITYTTLMNSVCYVLAVGGGGAGSGYTAGGGGAGGVVMVPVTLPAGTGTITITVGKGGTATTTTNAFSGVAGMGSNTTVTFSAPGVSIPSIIAYGGGTGAGGSATNSGLSGASGGGAKNTLSTGTNPGQALNYPYNYGNPGGYFRASAVSGGGGGAGTPGCTQSAYPVASTVYACGGNGIQCNLPGINTFSPSGTAYGSYYWGGGGGGTANVANCYTKGGLGGGGGGGIATGTTNPNTSGGGSALNPGGNGGLTSTSPGGSGGANTGGGGGGSWNNIGGNGGSGIVVISFPINSVNQFSLPKTSIFTNPSISTSTLKSAVGSFSCFLLNDYYVGPTVALRASTDTYGVLVTNFYPDSNGTLWTGYGTNKQTFLNWTNSITGVYGLAQPDGNYSYVTKWYDQSMYINAFNNAVQNNPTYQPIYDINNLYINFGYTGTNGGVQSPNATCYLTLPNGALPYNDSSFCYILKHNNIGTNTYASLLAGGTNAAGQTYALEVNTASAGYYGSEVNSTVVYNNLIYANSVQPNNVITARYNAFSTGGGANNLSFYVNDYSTSTTVSTALTVTNANVSIGASTSGWNPNCSCSQITYLFMFNTAISYTDQLTIKQNAGGYLTNGYLLGTTSTASVITIGTSPITTPVTTANLNGWYFTTSVTTTIGSGGVVLMNSYNGITAPPLGNIIYCYLGKAGGITAAGQYYINQSLVLYPKTYTLTYYIQARPTYYQNTQKVYAFINGVQNTPSSATTSWTQQTLTFTISSYGTYVLSLVVDNGVGQTDSSIAIAQITLQ